MDAGSVLITAAILLVTYCIWDYFSQPKNLPLGPWQYPIYGYLLTINWKNGWYKDLTQYRKQYGDVIRLKFGPHHGVVIHGMDRIREVFVEKADYFSERPDYTVLVNQMIGKSGEWITIVPAQNRLPVVSHGYCQVVLDGLGHGQVVRTFGIIAGGGVALRLWGPLSRLVFSTWGNLLKTGIYIAASTQRHVRMLPTYTPVQK